MKSVIVIFICIFITACSQNAEQNSNQTNVATASPSPKPTVSKEETDKENQALLDERLKAVNDFIAKNYKGWQFAGFGDALGVCVADIDYICDLLLTKGQLEKVVPVKMKHFSVSGDDARLVVYEARQIDLSKIKIEQIKERERQTTIENLDFDDCSSLCDFN